MEGTVTISLRDFEKLKNENIENEKRIKSTIKTMDSLLDTLDKIDEIARSLYQLIGSEDIPRVVEEMNIGITRIVKLTDEEERGGYND